MRPSEDLEAIERGFWLRGAEAFRERMLEDAVMVFPLPTGILTGAAILDGLEGAPRWEAVELRDVETRLVGDTAILAYRAAARRGDAPPYRALCLSVHVTLGRVWRLAAHQQTPEG